MVTGVRGAGQGNVIKKRRRLACVAAGIVQRAKLWQRSCVAVWRMGRRRWRKKMTPLKLSHEQKQVRQLRRLKAAAF